MPTFSFRGQGGSVYHGAYSRIPLEVRGQFVCSGPQPVGDGGVPEWVAAAFEQMPHVTTISVSSDTDGAVWTRMKGASEGSPPVAAG